MRELPLIPVLHGPLDGTEARYHPSGWLFSVVETSVHRYSMACDDTGARYWSYTGCVPLSAVTIGE